MTRSSLTETGTITRVVIKHAREAFQSADRIAAEWRTLAFTSPPDFDRALAEYDAFEAAIGATGAEILRLPAHDQLTLDSIYVRDAALVSPRGVMLAAMGKPARAGEPDAQRAACDAWRIPIAGAIEPPGRIEGGDVVWLDDRTFVVGRGYRTNDEGIRQVRALLGPEVEVIVVPLPHWRGHGDVFHLMSIISPVDRDLAVVYAPLLPVPFREWLLDRGIALVDVPDTEFDTMGANVLALAPRRCLMVDGNPITRARLETAGAHVTVYDGREISLKGGGGPTCLTRPLERRY